MGETMGTGTSALRSQDRAISALWQMACWQAMLAVPRPAGDPTGGNGYYASDVAILARAIFNRYLGGADG